MSQIFTSGGQSTEAFSFNISPSSECSGLISFRIDWLNSLQSKGTLKSLLQHYSSKASILQGSAQCPQPCTRPPLTHAFARDSWTLTGKSSSASFEVTALFSWVLVCTGFVCTLQKRIHSIFIKYKFICPALSLYNGDVCWCFKSLCLIPF